MKAISQGASGARPDRTSLHENRHLRKLRSVRILYRAAACTWQSSASRLQRSWMSTWNSLAFFAPTIEALFAAAMSGPATAVAWRVAFNLGLLATVAVGLASLIIGLVNRTHAFPFSHPWLHRLRQAHDVVLPLIPVALVWFTGLTGARLLRGGTWQDLSPEWQLVFARGCVGT